MLFFLQGNSGTGKSRLLMDAVMPYVTSVSGFIVQRLTENGNVIGFRAAPLEKGFPPFTSEFSPGLAGVFIIRGKYCASALEDVILRVERESGEAWCKMLLLDEIGGVDLASRVFTDALERILSGNKSCAGVFKSRDNLARMSRNLNLGRQLDALHRALEARIRSRGEILTMNGQTAAYARSYLTERIRQIFTVE